MNSQVYKESRKITIKGLLILLISTILGSIVLGYIYAYITYYISFLSFIPLIFFVPLVLICFMMGGVMISGLIVNYSKVGKIRNRFVTSGFALIACISFIYLYWVFRLKILTGGELFLHPDYSFSAIGFVLGFLDKELLVFIWIAEVIIILSVSLLTSKIDEVYCEKCNNWINYEKSIKYSLINNLNELRQGNIEILKYTERLEPDYSKNHILLKIGTCPECGETFCVSLEQINISCNKKGKTIEEKKSIVKNIIISTKQYNELNEF